MSQKIEMEEEAKNMQTLLSIGVISQLSKKMNETKRFKMEISAEFIDYLILNIIDKL